MDSKSDVYPLSCDECCHKKRVGASYHHTDAIAPSTAYGEHEHTLYV